MLSITVLPQQNEVYISATVCHILNQTHHDQT